LALTKSGANNLLQNRKNTVCLSADFLRQLIGKYAGHRSELACRPRKIDRWCLWVLAIPESCEKILLESGNFLLQARDMVCIIHERLQSRSPSKIWSSLHVRSYWLRSQEGSFGTSCGSWQLVFWGNCEQWGQQALHG
jgi:hypothetical protein